MRYYLRDLESDFSVFHRVDDIYSMPAARFFMLAYRIAAYDGMLARRIQAENEGRAAPAGPKPSGGPRRPRSVQPRLAVGKTPQGVQVVPDSAMGLMHKGLFERTRAPKARPDGAAPATEDPPAAG